MSAQLVLFKRASNESLVAIDPERVAMVDVDDGTTEITVLYGLSNYVRIAVRETIAAVVYDINKARARA